MVKKLFIGFVVMMSIISVIMVVITPDYKLTKIHNYNKRVYDKSLSYKELPTDCLIVLNSKYCICKKTTEVNSNSNSQYPQVQETLYLYNLEDDTKTEIINYDNYYNSFNYVMNDNSLFWIESYVNHTDIVSGEWKIRKYNLENKTISIIDEGIFDDFQKYAYSDINFGNESMLFPANMDISNDVLVYNRMIEENNSLLSQIVMYNDKYNTKTVIAQGDDYINNYVYDVAIDNNVIVYNKYHEKNTDKLFRPTTYKYCDIYTYNIDTEEIEQLSKNEYYIELNLSGEHVVAVRVPEREKNQDVFARMQIVLFNTNKKTAQIVLHYQSPIYKNITDLTLGNPQLLNEYIIWNDYTLSDNMNIYDYKHNTFIEIPTLNNSKNSSIIGASNDSIFVLDTTDIENGKMYMIPF